jgi:hypothetical protein
MEAKKNVPVKGAAKKLASRLKELGQKPTPKDLVNSLKFSRITK